MYSEQSDPWLEEPSLSSQSLFSKRYIHFNNRVIEDNIEYAMQQPILNTATYTCDLDQECTESKGTQTGQEALYNPLEEDENQLWIKKRGGNSERYLSCPSCFSQLAFRYKTEQEGKERVYLCEEVFGAVVQEGKVIRRLDVEDRMEWEGWLSGAAERQLREREQAINIKLVVDCECGVSIGYFDINRMTYVLTNVI